MSGDDQAQPVAVGEVLEVLSVEGREWQAVRQGARGDPGIVGWPGPTPLHRSGRDSSPGPGNVLAVGKDDHPVEPVLQRLAFASSPLPQLSPLGQFPERHESDARLLADEAG